MNKTAGRFFVVWCPSAGPPRARHDSVREARAEAARLALMPKNKGHEFIILRAVEAVRLPSKPLVGNE